MKRDPGHMPLLQAAARGDMALVRALVEQGFRVDNPDDSGWTPLMEAAWGGHGAVVKFLLEKGADPWLSNRDGFTALMYAQAWQNREIVALIVDALARQRALSEPSRAAPRE